MILIIPYRAGDYVKKIEASFERINLKGLNLSNVRYLSTKELTPADKENRSLNFLGGFVLMDKEMRCYVIEGLGGVGKCMEEFYLENEREAPNNKKFKMLYNPEIRFKDRIYMEFNCAIKKIKLRDTISTIIEEPDIYLRAKVPENMYDTL